MFKILSIMKPTYQKNRSTQACTDFLASLRGAERCIEQLRRTFLGSRLCLADMDLIHIGHLEEPQIPGVVKVINEAYAVEATFKKDPTRISEAAFRELVNSGSGRHYIATADPESPLHRDLPSLSKDNILGHI